MHPADHFMASLEVVMGQMAFVDWSLVDALRKVFALAGDLPSVAHNPSSVAHARLGQSLWLVWSSHCPLFHVATHCNRKIRAS